MCLFSPRIVLLNASVPLAVEALPLIASLGLLFIVSSAGQGLAQANPHLADAAQRTDVQAPVAQHFLFVNPIVGNDTSGNGSQSSPFRTIAHALQSAQAGTVIMLALGTYSTDTGEMFPLVLKPGVSIQGDPSTQGRGIVIRGGGLFLSPTSTEQNVTIVGADQSQLVGVTITNPHSGGYGLWIESGSPIVANNTFTGNGVFTVNADAPRRAVSSRSQPESQTAAAIEPVTPAAADQQTAERSGNSGELTREPSDHSSLTSSSSPASNSSRTPSPSIANRTLVNSVQPATSWQPASPQMPLPAFIESTPQPEPSATSSTPLSTSPTQAITELPPPISSLPPQPRPQPAVSSPPSQLTAAVVTPTVARSPSSPTAVTVAVAPSRNAVLSRSPSASVSASVPVAPVQTTPVQATVPVSVTPAAPPRQTTAASQPVAAIATPPPPTTLSRQTASALRPISAPTNASASAFSAVAASSSSSSFNLPIDIPVPPPESGQVALAQTTRRDLPSPPSNSSAPSGDILPVPDGNVPLGNIDGMPTVAVARNAFARTGGGMSFSSASRFGLRYRVVVDAESDQVQSAVQSIVPGAFLTSINGQSLIQVGAFSSRDNAEQAVQMLSQNGLTASIQEME
ncbi:MAG: hypothetical protein Kow00121_30960 [Elainellaceae cyanobacterium]